MKKLLKSKIGEKFGTGIIAIFLSMTITMLAFISEENKITGLVTYDYESVEIPIQPLLEFKDVDSLGTLAPGNYYIDENSIVYWLDDESKPAIAKVNFVDESQKNSHIYIDDLGRVGYILESVS